MKNKILKLLKAIILLAVIGGVFWLTYTAVSSHGLAIFGFLKVLGIAFAAGVIFFLADKFGGDD